MSGANVDNVFDRVETKVKGLLDENAQLREQNRVLRSNLVNCAARLEAYYGEDYPAVRDAKAALTATTPAAAINERCSYCQKPLTTNHRFSYGFPGVSRVYKCDRAECIPLKGGDGE